MPQSASSRSSTLPSTDRVTAPRRPRAAAGLHRRGLGCDARRSAWIDANIRAGHGPLGAAYRGSGFDPTQPGQQEGDTPSFLHLVGAVRGLNDPDQPDQGGWGGRFVRPDPSRNHWFDDPGGPETLYRWRREVQEAFAERAGGMSP
jgi:hypothetical protein